MYIVHCTVLWQPVSSTTLCLPALSSPVGGHWCLGERLVRPNQEFYCSRAMTVCFSLGWYKLDCDALYHALWDQLSFKSNFFLGNCFAERVMENNYIFLVPKVLDLSRQKKNKLHLLRLSSKLANTKKKKLIWIFIINIIFFIFLFKVIGRMFLFLFTFHHKISKCRNMRPLLNVKSRKTGHGVQKY